MIKIISNNFGAECLDFRSFEKEGLMVANGRFYFDPSNAAYRAADVLEIKVSDMMLSKRTNAAVYLVDRDNEMPHATLLKAWVKDCNTICIDTVTGTFGRNIFWREELCPCIRTVSSSDRGAFYCRL